MVRIVLCDDDQELLQSLKSTVEVVLELNGISCEITTFTSGELLMQDFQQFYYDIIFLDVEMGELNGIDTAKMIRSKDKQCIIIFVTAYTDFVFQGYEVRALNYILKPYKTEKIRNVLEEAIQECTVKSQLYYMIESKGIRQKISFDEIKYFKSDKRKIIIATTNNYKYEFYGKINDVERELPNYFIRIHQRYLVNMNNIINLSVNSCKFEDEIIPVSRSHSNQALIAFTRFVLK